MICAQSSIPIHSYPSNQTDTIADTLGIMGLGSEREREQRRDHIVVFPI
jgi:hypothetical protein